MPALPPEVADHPARILIVDDERHNRDLLEAMLTPEGFYLESASSGEEALAMVAKQPPDLMLLDIMMPGMDGYQVAAQIKGTAATKHIPIIMVTALDTHDVRMLGLGAGVEELLTKPVNRAELCARVKNLLRLKAYGDFYEQRAGVLTERTALQEALEKSRQVQLRFKDEFLSHVSHELRSPLTAIKQFSSILLAGLAGELNKEQREYQEIVLKNIRQLQSMIDDLLEVTRLETGKLTIELERTSVTDAVTDTLNTLEGTARVKGVTISRDLPPGLPFAYADQTRLRQILIILLDNAIKFTNSGGVITIAAQRLADDPQFLLVEVSDTGSGISAEAAEKLFERLYQESEPNQSGRKGLGLGLYICKQLVTRQGGRIWGARRREAGSTFSFTLPVFSLNHLIAPLLRDGQWPAESAALITVDVDLAEPWSSKESHDEWTREARNVLQRCLLPDLDILLPTMTSDAHREHFFVAAFADVHGASVLANRIREQFDRHRSLKTTGLSLAVSSHMLPLLSRDTGASTDTMVTSVAADVEELIRTQLNSNAVLT